MTTKRRSTLARELKPYLLRALEASAAGEVDLDSLVSQVAASLGQQYVTQSAFTAHTGNRNAHHQEIHDILSFHTADGSPYDLVGLDGGGALSMRGSHWDARNYPNQVLRTINGSIALASLDTDQLWGLLTGNINLMSALKSSNYASQTAGFRIVPSTGEADFRYIYSDEMHVRIFFADLARALSGVDLIAKSVAEIAVAFVAPNPGSSTFLYLQDHKAMPGIPLMEDQDYLGIQYFSVSGGSLILGWCWGKVSNYFNVGNKTQRWTFTRIAGTTIQAGSMPAGTVIQPGGVALDYGKDGNGYVELNAIDGPGAANAPYLSIVQWYGHPASGKVNRVRLGNLRGVGFEGKHGLYVRGSSDDQYLLANGDGITGRNTTDSAWNGSSQTYSRLPDGTLKLGSNLAVPSSNSIAIFGATQKFNDVTYAAGDIVIGNPAGANIYWSKAIGRFFFRTGTTVRAYIDTDGSLKAANGAVQLNDAGINIEVLSGSSTALLRFLQSGVQKSSISSFHSTGPSPDLQDGLVLSDSHQVRLSAPLVSVEGVTTFTQSTYFKQFNTWLPIATSGSGNGVFITGWGNVGSVGADNYETAAYRKVGDIVQVRGLVKRTSGSATTLWVMPAGYRPIKRAWRTSSGYDTGYKMARIDVTPAGSVVLVNANEFSAVNFLSVDLEFSTI